MPARVVAGACWPASFPAFYSCRAISISVPLIRRCDGTNKGQMRGSNCADVSGGVSCVSVNGSENEGEKASVIPETL